MPKDQVNKAAVCGNCRFVLHDYEEGTFLCMVITDFVQPYHGCRMFQYRNDVFRKDDDEKSTGNDNKSP